MSSRRDFLKTSVAAVALSGFSSSARGAAAKAIGLQLYSVRRQCQHDLPAVLAKVKQIGYQEVETFSELHSRPAVELKRMVDDAGLRLPSGHFDYARFDSFFEYAHTLGLSYIICSYLPHNEQKPSPDDYKRAAANFNCWGERAQRAGMRFAFHNHNYEFQKIGDSNGYNMLIAETDPKLVYFEMDCYWVAQAGYDPVLTMKSMPGRVRLLHLKDRQRGAAVSQKLDHSAEHFTEVGTGTLDFKSIVAAARAVGVEHYFVEQDEITRPVDESLTTSFQYTKRLLSE